VTEGYLDETAVMGLTLMWSREWSVWGFFCFWQGLAREELVLGGEPQDSFNIRTLTLKLVT